MKNQRIKINTNRTPIDSKRIGQMQDFGEVMKGFTVATLPFYKKWWFWGSVGTAMLGAAIIAASAYSYKETTPVLANESPMQAVSEATVPQQEAFIKPAFKGFDVDFTTFTVTSGKAKTLTMNSGTLIKIPACNFVYDDGKQVEGNVEIRFREMTDPVDFAVSGIPMTYDSAGQRYLFESAGMCEIKGYKNGVPVQVNPQCPITIEQTPVSEDPKFNLYYLDTVARNWQYLGKPKRLRQAEEVEMVNENNSIKSIGREPSLTITSTDKRAESALEKEIRELKNKTPHPPHQLNVTKNNFTLFADSTGFPELFEFVEVTFVPAEDVENNFKPAIYNYNWGRATVSISDSVTGRLTLKLQRGGYVVAESDTSFNELPNNNKHDAVLRNLTWWERFVQSIRHLFTRKHKGTKVPKNKVRAKRPSSNSNKLAGGDSVVYYEPGKIRLVPINQSDYNPLRYNLKNTTEISLEVYPVFAGEDYEKAYEEFKQKLVRHNDLLAEKMALLEKHRKEAEEQRKAQIEQWQKMQQQQLARQLANANNTQLEYWNIRNAFAAEKFGIYNSDSPIQLTKASTISLDFADETGSEQYVDKAYLVIKSRNALMANYYNKCCNNTLKYVATDQNQLFVVLPDDYVGVVENRDFNNFAGKQDYEVRLRKSSKPMKSTGELKAFLGLLPQTESDSTTTVAYNR